MDEITDTIEGSLSLNAKEWKPGQGFKSQDVPASSASAQEHNAGGAVSASSDYGDKSSQSVDVNGTHFFGASTSTSWGSSGQHHHTSVAQSSPIVNSAHTHTTIPSHSLQKHRNPRRVTLSNSLSLPDEDYHHYRELSLRAAQEMNPNDPRHKLVPPSFYRAYCLDSRHENDTVSNTKTITQQRSSFGYPPRYFELPPPLMGICIACGEWTRFAAFHIKSAKRSCINGYLMQVDERTMLLDSIILALFGGTSAS